MEQGHQNDRRIYGSGEKGLIGQYIRNVVIWVFSGIIQRALSRLYYFSLDATTEADPLLPSGNPTEYQNIEH